MFHERRSFKDVLIGFSRVFLECYKEVDWCFEGVLRVFQVSFKGVS